MATKLKKHTLLELAQTAVSEARSGAFSSDPKKRAKRKSVNAGATPTGTKARPPKPDALGSGMAKKAGDALRSRGTPLMDIVDEMETGTKKKKAAN